MQLYIPTRGVPCLDCLLHVKNLTELEPRHDENHHLSLSKSLKHFWACQSLGLPLRCSHVLSLVSYNVLNVHLSCRLLRDPNLGSIFICLRHASDSIDRQAICKRL
jgi:hypothetical protein